MAGIRTSPLGEMAEVLPEAYDQLLETMKKMELHYKDMQDMEFTIENGVLTCCRPATASAPQPPP